MVYLIEFVELKGVWLVELNGLFDWIGWLNLRVGMYWIKLDESN